MNIFSNIGITELVVILLLALLVVGPERLPEMGRKLAKTLRDIRQMYDNLTSELGPELMSIQQGAKELRDSVESVRSIPKDTVKSVVDAADLDDTIAELKEVASGLEEVGKTVSGVGKMVKDPVRAAVDTARGAILPSDSSESEVGAGEEPAEQEAVAEVPAVAEATAETSNEPEAVGEAPAAAEAAAEATPEEPPEPEVVEDTPGEPSDE